MTKTALIASSIVLALSTNVAHAGLFGNSNKSKKSNTEIMTQEEVEQKVLGSLREGALENARQFELLNELTRVNRADPETKNNLSLVKGIEADVQIQSAYHPHKPLNHREIAQMIKEGDTGRTRPKNYAKIFPTGGTFEPVNAGVGSVFERDSQPVKVHKIAKAPKMSTQSILAGQNVGVKTIKIADSKMNNQTNSYDKIKSTNIGVATPQKYSGQSDISKYLSMPNVVAMNTYATQSTSNKLPINNTENTAKYIGSNKNVPKKTYQTTTSPLTPSKAVSSSKTNKTVVDKNVSQAKKAVVNNAYKDFGKTISLSSGKYQINELLARVAKETGYQLIIDDEKNIGQKLDVNINSGFKGTHADVLKAISGAIKSKGVGKLFINANEQKIRIAYTK